MAGMPASRIRRRAIVAVLALTLAAGIWIAAPYVSSAALLLDLAEPGSRLRAWLPVRVRALGESVVAIPTRHGPVNARLHVPTSRSRGLIVIVPGVHAGGVDEPRLAALARRLAAAGTTVITLPLPDLRRYRITPHSTDQIEDAVIWAASQPDLARDGRVGVIGVSFAGGLALVAAGRPGLRGRVNGVASLGGHSDLPRAMAYACTGRLPDGTIRPPHDYGVVLVLLAGIPRVAPPDQVAALDRAVVTFLDASSDASMDPARSAAGFAAARQQADALPEPSRTLMRWVNDRDVGHLGQALLPYVEELGGDAALSPERSPATTAPVFLLHGSLDTVIPSSEAPRLTAYLRRAGNTRVESLLTPIVSHATMQTNYSAMDGWRLVRFWTNVWAGLRN
jgi:dienelactone hydrolase